MNRGSSVRLGSNRTVRSGSFGPVRLVQFIDLVKPSVCNWLLGYSLLVGFNYLLSHFVLVQKLSNQTRSILFIFICYFFVFITCGYLIKRITSVFQLGRKMNKENCYGRIRADPSEIVLHIDIQKTNITFFF
jgi:hypothetical protein